RETAVFSDRPFGASPPLFKIALGDNFRRQGSLQLVLGCFAAETLQDQLNELRDFVRRQIAENSRFVDLPDKYVGLRQRLKSVRCVLQLHRVVLLGVEIHHDLIEKEIPAAYLSESPTFVEAKSVRFQLVKRG